jgi:hypothetical protein
MPNLLPPRPGGTLAAIAACPDADVIFVAHAGLDTILTVGDIWRRFPVDQVLRAKWWRVPSGQVPRAADHETQVHWLYDWWERIDTWITEHRLSGAAVPAAVPLAGPYVQVLHLLLGDVEVDTGMEPRNVAGGDLHFLATPHMLFEQYVGHFAGLAVDAERAELADVAVGGVHMVAAVLLLRILGPAEEFRDQIAFFDHADLPEFPAVKDVIASIGRLPALLRGKQLYFAVARHQLRQVFLGGGEALEFLLGVPEPDCSPDNVGDLG